MRPELGWLIGDVVQIVDETHAWHPCLVVVTEPKSWGIQGCVLIPQSNNGDVKPSQAFIRLRDEQVEWIGGAIYVPQ